MTSLVEVRGLRYTYPDGTRALDGVDFDLAKGECVALFGANGSGKTTFILHIAGLLKGEGSVKVHGNVGLVFQDSDEQLFMPTVLEDVAFGLLNQGVPPDAARQRALRELDLAGIIHVADKAPYHLSAGEKRRVAIAGVLVMNPEILVLDEPTTFLDPPAQRELARLLSVLPQAKIVVTHDTGFAQSVAKRAVFFEKGRVAGEGVVDDVIRRFEWSPRSESPAHRS